MFPFNFSIKKTQPATIPDIATYDWTYAYQYPLDCLYLMSVSPFPSLNAATFTTSGLSVSDITKFDVNLTSDSAYKVIYSNIENAYITYASDVEDTTKFDDLFSETLSYFLALKLAMSLSGDNDIIRTQKAMFNESLNVCKELNAQEGNTLEPVHDNYVRARRN